MLLALSRRLACLLATGLLLGLAARIPARAEAEAFLRPPPARTGAFLPGTLVQPESPFLSTSRPLPASRLLLASRFLPVAWFRPKSLAGLAPRTPTPRWRASTTNDLWFRPEPIRRRWHLAAIGNGRETLFALEHASHVGGNSNGGGWWLGLRVLLQPRQANPLMAAGPVAFESSRWTLGYQRPAGQLWWGVFAGMARQSLDVRGLLLTRQAVRHGAVIGAHGWLLLPLPGGQTSDIQTSGWQTSGSQTPGRQTSGFLQFHAEYDDARAAWGLLIRGGLPVAGSEIRLGPELIASGGSRLQAYGLTYREPFRHWRAGLHLHGIPLAKARLSLSVGREQAARETPRPYALVELGLAY